MTDIFDTRFEDTEVDVSDNKIEPGDIIKLTELDPTIRHLHVGFGWNVNNYSGESLDLDVSLFLLDKDNMTRENEDFVYFNNMEACGGGIQHQGDNRDGAGDGDDEIITIDLQAIPFEIVQVAFAVSIYKGREKGQNLAQMYDSYLRILNTDTGLELVRYDMDEIVEGSKNTAMLAGFLNREGPNWTFIPHDEQAEHGLAEFATRYGLVIAQQ